MEHCCTIVHACRSCRILTLSDSEAVTGQLIMIYGSLLFTLILCYICVFSERRLQSGSCTASLLVLELGTPTKEGGQLPVATSMKSRELSICSKLKRCKSSGDDKLTQSSILHPSWLPALTPRWPERYDVLILHLEDHHLQFSTTNQLICSFRYGNVTVLVHLINQLCRFRASRTQLQTGQLM